MSYVHGPYVVQGRGRVPMITITNEWKREGDGESAFVALERAVDEGRPVLGFHAS